MLGGRGQNLMSDEDIPIGLTLPEASQSLKKLFARREKIESEMASLAQKSIFDGIPINHVDLSSELEDLNEQIDKVRELYNIGLSESLCQESKRLNKLTIELMMLTALLGIFSVVDIAEILSRLIH